MQFGFGVFNGTGQVNRSGMAGISHNLAELDAAGLTVGPLMLRKGSINEMIAMTEAIPLFDKIDGEQIKVIASHMQIMQLDERQQLFAEGEHGDYMCFIVSGTLEVFKQSQHGRMVSVSTLHRGRSIGEMALTDAFPRSASVIAQTPCTLLVITRDGFDQILEECPRAGVSLLRSLSRVLSLYLRRTSGQLADARELAGSASYAPALEEKASKESRLIDHILKRKPASPAPMVRRFI